MNLRGEKPESWSSDAHPLAQEIFHRKHLLLMLPDENTQPDGEEPQDTNHH